MAVAVADSGTTATLTQNTEIVLKTGYGTHSLGTATGRYTAAGVYVCVVNTTNMVAGNIIELRCYLAVLAAGDEQLAYYATYTNVQGQKIKLSVPIPADATAGSIKFTIKQTDTGTMKAYPWKVLTI